MRTRRHGNCRKAHSGQASGSVVPVQQVAQVRVRERPRRGRGLSLEGFPREPRGQFQRRAPSGAQERTHCGSRAPSQGGARGRENRGKGVRGSQIQIPLQFRVAHGATPTDSRGNPGSHG